MSQHRKIVPAILSILIFHAVDSLAYVPRVEAGSNPNSDIHLEKGSPCRWSFSKDYSNPSGSNEINVGLIQVLKCGNNTSPASTPTTFFGPSLPPGFDAESPSMSITPPTSVHTSAAPSKSSIAAPLPSFQSPVISSIPITVPLTPNPITPSPVTTLPITPFPVTPLPTTYAPLTLQPLTPPPVNPIPTTDAPATSRPSTFAPVVATTTDAPIYSFLSTAPVAETPDISIFTTETPVILYPIATTDVTVSPLPTISTSFPSLTTVVTPITAAPITAPPKSSVIPTVKDTEIPNDSATPTTDANSSLVQPSHKSQHPTQKSPLQSAHTTHPTSPSTLSTTLPQGNSLSASSIPSVSTALEITIVPSVSESRCVGYTDSQRTKALVKQAKEVSSAESLLNDTSVQSAAIRWMIQDELTACPEDENFKQRYALAVFYFATIGDDWKSCSQIGESIESSCAEGANRFLSASSECSWGGCECDTSGMMVRLSLENNNLQGTIPKEIGALSQLTELDLEHNSLSGTIPHSIASLSRLEYLDLDENKLFGTIPEKIYSLSMLKALDLDTNMLTGTISSNIANLEELYIVQYDNNRMTGTIPSQVGLLPQLEYFTIAGNSFDGTVPETVCNSAVTVLANCDLCSIKGCCKECQ